MAERKKILVCNDDGIEADGLIAIAKALIVTNRFDIRIVAPVQCQSAKSHSITLRGYLTATEHKYPEELASIPSFKVDGTPADCVKVGLNTNLTGDWKPDLVVSGINKGLNTGVNVHYSGTVGGAREANICGIMGVALSMEFCGATTFHYEDCAIMAVQFIDILFEKSEGREEEFSRFVFNINFPNVPLDQNMGFRFSQQGLAIFKDDLIELSNDKDETGATQIVFTIKGEYFINSDDINVGSAAVANQFTAITTLPLLTDRLPPNKEISEWKIFKQKKSSK